MNANPIAAALVLGILSASGTALAGSCLTKMDNGCLRTNGYIWTTWQPPSSGGPVHYGISFVAPTTDTMDPAISDSICKAVWTGSQAGITSSSNGVNYYANVCSGCSSYLNGLCVKTGSPLAGYLYGGVNRIACGTGLKPGTAASGTFDYCYCDTAAGYNLMADNTCQRCDVQTVYIPATRSCVRPNCSDDNVCNGEEVVLADGGCAPGTVLDCSDGDACTTDSCTADAGCSHGAVDCDDSVSCTVDRCDSSLGCLHDVDAGACTCEGGLPSIPVGYNGELVLAERPCAGRNPESKFGAKLTFAAAGSAQPASCSNGCVMKSSLQASLGATLAMCSSTEFTATAQGTVGLETKHEPVCDPLSCSSGCSDRDFCQTEETSGSVDLGASRFYGLNEETPFPGGSIVIKCGGTIGFTGSAAGSVKVVSAAGSPSSCVACRTQSGTYSVGASAGLDCMAGIQGWAGWESGCKKCVSASVSGSISLTSTEGACPATACAEHASRAEATGNIGSPSAGFKWWRVSASCNFSMAACTASNTCGACACGGASCGDFKTDFTCSVCTGNSVLPQCAPLKGK